MDLARKLPGRGAHLCRVADCLHRAIEKRLFNKAFKTNIDGNVFRALSCDFRETGCFETDNESMNRAPVE